ncbi:outer membrane beta-barrel protein [Sandaracinobacteroides saxicola]|uniref:Porin family protein n=1 Tax=Sandaracinobacteroides saxicola TaxID=2759707 RepID=A0A7G5IFG5_9SPHN|nr:outer membrane beta-barrel protein [Sandaracinobacteroides saxicola]QMW22107.1 porin family protein [Sandaracinobacteroides saxicola]
MQKQLKSAAFIALFVPFAMSHTAASADDGLGLTGFYAGPEIGLHEHHVYIAETDIPTGQTRGQYYRGWGVGGGAFIGYDFAVARRTRLGVEAGVSLGGEGPTARFADGAFYTSKPRWGYRLTGKAGYFVTTRLLAYATFGYGGHRYRVQSLGIDDVKSSGSSFTVGGGLEYRISDAVGVRLDFRHLDNQMSHLLIGIPIRF